MIMFTWVVARQKIDFPLQKRWFDCNTNSNYLCRKNMTPC